MISSELACLFLGDYAPIDYGDGSIMGLLDIRTKHWDPRCLDVSNDVLILYLDMTNRASMMPNKIMFT